MAASALHVDSTNSSAPRDRRGLLAIVALALLQGLVLFGLHHAVARAVWPATSATVLTPLYLNAMLLPLTAQLLVRFFGHPRLTWSLVVMAAALTAFGWHHAAYVAPMQEPRAFEFAFASALALAVLWLIAVAFLRAQLETGRNAPEYRALFAAAWRNTLTLLEASMFVGVFWLLLELWAVLFDTLEIAFFADLFSSPAFAYPATALAIGIALHLIGSVDRMVDVVLAQVLSVFKWLAPVAGLIVVLFAIALVPELPRLVAADERPLDSVWLLWLVAVTVLLLNAAYQDGTAERPYGAALSAAMRFVPPLLALIALTATYALYVRIDTYGMTVSRFWGFATACVALAHAVAASIAAARRGPWLGYTSKTNPILAAALAVVLILALTPVLSPYRLAAASQQRIALETDSKERLSSALTYLRFSAGSYGREALEALAALESSNPELATSAEHALQAQYPGPRPAGPPRDYDTWRSELRVYPEARPIPDALERALRDAPRRPPLYDAAPSFALWVDLVGGPELELFLLLETSEYELYTSQDDGAWRLVSRGFTHQSYPWDPRERELALVGGDFGTVPPELPELRIGPQRVSMVPMPDPTIP